jgi:uncharacterized Zn finger protein (UPF0148 family)
MFEEETVDISCPKCGHRNSLMVREVEAQTESHIVCGNCGVGVKIETQGFRERFVQVRKELKEIERQALRESKKPKARPTKDDYSI